MKISTTTLLTVAFLFSACSGPPTGTTSSGVTTQSISDTEIGIIVAFGGRENDIPSGWKPCDGRLLWSGAYPTAANKIGGIWGDYDANAFFTLPNLGGYFLRGIDYDGDVDTDWGERTDYDGNKKNAPIVGMFQKDEVLSHKHSVAAQGADWRSGAEQGNGHKTAHERGGQGDR